MFGWGLISMWLGIWLDYAIAALMIAGGVYLAILFDLASANPLYWLLKPLRWAGIGIACAGVLFGGYTYGKSVGAEAVTTEWKAKNLEAQIERQKQELQARDEATKKVKEALEQIAEQKNDLEKQVADYQQAVAQLPVCRRATDDDDRRVCDIIGNAAAGCKPAK